MGCCSRNRIGGDDRPQSVALHILLSVQRFDSVYGGTASRDFEADSWIETRCGHAQRDARRIVAEGDCRISWRSRLRGNRRGADASSGARSSGECSIYDGTGSCGARGHGTTSWRGCWSRWISIPTAGWIPRSIDEWFGINATTSCCIRIDRTGQVCH